MQRWTRVLVGVVLVGFVPMTSLAGVECVARGPYFGATAEATAQRFAPGVASTQYHDDFSPVFSADGSTAILRIVGEVNGEIAASFFVTSMDDSGCWGPPHLMPFSGQTRDGAIAFAPEGNTLFFTSRRPAPGDADEVSASRVWRVDRVDDGWGEPELLDSPVNAFNVNGGLTVDGDGNLFVSLESELGVGGADIYLLRNVEGRYPTIEVLPGAVNTSAVEVAPCVDPERRFLLFTTMDGDGPAIRLSLPDGDGGWGVGAPLPTLDGTAAKFAAVSPDGRQLFFVSHRQDEGANPPAAWDLQLYDPPTAEDNADVYWMRSDGVLPELAQDAPAWNPSIALSIVADGLYRLSTDQGNYTTNSLAFVGDDGVLLVDTQAETDAAALKRLVMGFGRGTPKIIIYTHRHVEHVGGTAAFGTDPLVIAHELVRSKLRSGSYLFNEFPEATLPDIGFPDRMTLSFNGERIELEEMAGSHDDNEIMVHFTGRKVVHLSSLTNGFNLPSIDSDGDALAFAGLIRRAIDELPHDVTIVSGHNDNGSWQDLQPYLEMLEGTVAAVTDGLAAGLDVESMRAAKILAPWEKWAGSYVSTDRWIDYVAQALEPEERKKTVFEELYDSLHENGAEAAVAHYRQLKAEHPDDYDFGEADLLVIGDKLLDKDRPEAAIPFLQLSASEFPDSRYAYYTYFDLAMALDRVGSAGDALAACRKALELSPDNPAIKTLLARLEAAGDPGP